MSNQYPIWKYLIIFCVLVTSFIYAAPNLYLPDPAVQISGESSSLVMDERVLARISKALEQHGIKYSGQEIQQNAKSILVRFADDEAQLKGQGIIKQTLGDGYITALNRASNTPQWLKNFGAGPLKLGLDLSGGVHFLLEVDVEEALKKALESSVSSTKTEFREAKIRGLVSREGNTVSAKFSSQQTLEKAQALFKKNYPNFEAKKVVEDGDHYIQTWALPEKEITRIQSDAVSQNLTTLRNRVNELGVAEPLVQRQGKNRIVVELPGIQDTAAAKRIIGKTANLEFRLEAAPDASFSNKESFAFRDRNEGPNAWLERDIIVTGDQVISAQSSFDSQTNQPQVNITLDGNGGKRMNRVTRDNIKRNMGVLFIERKVKTHLIEDQDGNKVEKKEKYFDKKIISLATIQSALGVQFRITGLRSPAEAAELALLLRAGALAAPIDFVEERTVGPSLGKENIRNGLLSVLFGLASVMVFMLLYYRLFGVLANIALTLNLVVLIAVMSSLSATLTLPGIAGIVLTVGMAVDANVLIFSRIKEELKLGSSPQMAISQGYSNAFTAIFDANITTLLVAVILYAIGTGPIKGFAVTLSIGILTSMFTAIMVTRALISLTVGKRKIEKLWI